VSVSINKADAVELESIKGIGPMLAQRILDYRAANGPFKQLEDLVQVPGIGQGKFEKIKSQLSL
jgi:competence protein ComEA